MHWALASWLGKLGQPDYFVLVCARIFRAWQYVFWLTLRRTLGLSLTVQVMVLSYGKRLGRNILPGLGNKAGLLSLQWGLLLLSNCFMLAFGMTDLKIFFPTQEFRSNSHHLRLRPRHGSSMLLQQVMIELVGHLHTLLLGGLTPVHVVMQ